MLTDAGGRSAASGELLEGAPQMRPADLPASKRQMRVGRIAIRADDRRVIRAEQLLDPVAAPACSNFEHGDVLGHRRPQPGLAAAFPPAGLVEVDDSLSANERPRLLDRIRQGRRHLLFHPADRARRPLDPEAVGQQLDDGALAQAVGPGQQADPGLHAGTVGVPRYPVGPIRCGQETAVPTAESVHLIFDDVGAHRRDDDLLVALRMGIVSAKRVTAPATLAGLDRDQPVHFLDLYPRAGVPFVPGLGARQAAGGLGATRRGSTRSRRSGLGPAAGPTLAAGQFLLQLRDPPRQLLRNLLEVANPFRRTDHQGLYGGRRALPVPVGNRNVRGALHGRRPYRKNPQTHN